MNKITKALSFALNVCIVINIVGLSVAIFISGVESVLDDFKRIGGITIAMFFIPPFFAVYFFGEKSLRGFFKTTLLSMLPSFLIVYCIVFLNLSLVKDLEIPFWNKTSLFNGIVACTVSVFSLLIYYLVNYNPLKKREYVGFHFPLKRVLIIWFVITIIYFLLFYVLGGHFFLKGILDITIKGLIASFLVFKVFKYFQNNTVSNAKRKRWLVLIYIFNTLVLPTLFYVSLFIDRENKSLEKLVQSITIVGPYFLMITLTVHVYFIFMLNQYQKKELLYRSISYDIKYQQLKAQLSPHFLFNNISVLTGLIEENAQKAVAFSEKLSSIYRYILDNENKDLVSLIEELSFAQKYLELLNVRFENAIYVNNKVNLNKDYYLVPMSLQLILENIIKHNELNEENPIVIDLFIESKNLVVSNNLQYKPVRQSLNALGLENIKKRYGYFTDEEVIINKSNSRFTIKLPLINIDH